MTNVSTVEMRKDISDILGRVTYGKERFAVTRNGKTVAAVIPIEDLRLLEALEDKLDALLGQEALEAHDRGHEPALTLDEVRARLGLE